MCFLFVFFYVCLFSENIFDEDNCVMVKKYFLMYLLELIKDVGMFFMLKQKYIGLFCKNFQIYIVGIYFYVFIGNV